MVFELGKINIFKQNGESKSFEEKLLYFNVFKINVFLHYESVFVLSLTTTF